MDDIKTSLRESASRVIDLFHKLDKNSDGSVSAAELNARLPEIGFGGLDQAAITELFKTLDIDGSGSIGYRELHKMLRPGADVVLPDALQPGAMGDIAKDARNATPLRD